MTTMMDLPCRRYIDGRPVELDTEFNPWTDYPDDGTDHMLQRRPPAPPRPRPVRVKAAPKPKPAPKARTTKYGMESLVVGESRHFFPKEGQHIRNLHQRILASAWFRKQRTGQVFTAEMVDRISVKLTRTK